MPSAKRKDKERPSATKPAEVRTPPLLPEDYGFQVVKHSATLDNRGRLTLGFQPEASAFQVSVNAQGQILLEPVVTLPQRELWLWRNPVAVASVKRGLEQAARWETVDLGSFSQYANLELESDD